MEQGARTDVRGRAVSGVLWSALQRGTVRASTLLTFVVLGRLLAPEDFGLVALATALVALVNVFSEVGAGTYVIQHPDLDDRQVSTVFWNGVGLSAVLAVLLVLAAPPLAGALDQEGLTPVVQALGALVLLSSLSSVPSAVLKRDLQFRTLAVRSMAASIVAAVVAVAVALLGGGVWSLVVQYLVHTLVSIVILWTVTSWRPRLAYDTATSGSALRYGSSVLAIQLVTQLRLRADVLVISIIAGPVVLGLYTVAGKILNTVLDTVVAVISTVAGPVFARLKDDLPRLGRAYREAVTTALAIVSPLLVALVLAAPWGIPFVFGDQWEPAVVPAQVLVVAGLVTTLVFFDRNLMIALDQRRKELALSIATTLAGILVVAVAARWGVVGVAIAVSARAVLAWPFRLRLSSRLLEQSAVAYAGSIGRILVATVSSAGLGALVLQLPGAPPLVTAASVLMATFVYGIVLRLVAPAAFHRMLATAARALQKRRPPEAGAPTPAEVVS